LDDPAETVAQYRRLGVSVTWPHARAYLARTKYLGLDVLADSVPRAGVAEQQMKVLGVLLLAEAPEAAPALLSVKLRAKPAKADVIERDAAVPAGTVTPQEARFWLRVCVLFVGPYGPDLMRTAIRKLNAEQFNKPLPLGDVKAALDKLEYWTDVAIPVLKMQA